MQKTSKSSSFVTLVPSTLPISEASYTTGLKTGIWKLELLCCRFVDLLHPTSPVEGPAIRQDNTGFSRTGASSESKTWMWNVEMSFLPWPHGNLFSQCSLWHLGIWTTSRNHKAQLVLMDMSSSFCSEWSSSFLPTLSPTYQDRIQDCPLDMGQPSKFAATVSSTGFGSTKTRTKREYKSWKRTSLLDLKINLPWISERAFFPVVFLIALCGSTVHKVKSMVWMVNWCNYSRIETRQSLPSSTLDCGHQCPWHSHLRFGVWLRRFLQAKMANKHKCRNIRVFKCQQIKLSTFAVWFFWFPVVKVIN